VLNKYVKHTSQHRYAHRSSSKLALKSSTARKTTTTRTAVTNAATAKTAATDGVADSGDNSSALPAPSWIPPSVANANAQVASADTPAGNASAMSARANNILQTAPDNPANSQPAADAPVVSADQLNDVDRSLRENTPPAAAPAMAPADTPAPAPPAAAAARPAPVTAGRGESATWDQTSLIGKIFIGFGALLTMASAARMFMA